MAIVKSALAAPTVGVLIRRDAAAPARPLNTETPNPRLVILLKSRLGVSPPCLIAYSSSLMVTPQGVGRTCQFSGFRHRRRRLSEYKDITINWCGIELWQQRNAHNAGPRET